VCRDIFVRQSPTESDESDELGHPPRATYMSDESDSVGATGRDTRVEPRDESNTTASARGDQESRSRRRHVEPRPKRGSRYCRTLSERRVDSSLRLYNLSRSVSHQL
jgi:hypothetical protein